jgi:hypothetical protein
MSQVTAGFLLLSDSVTTIAGTTEWSTGRLHTALKPGKSVQLATCQFNYSGV